jgi:O-antigen/teichoic acid export membrane protein
MIDRKFIKNNLFYFSSVVIGGVLGYLFNFILGHNLSVAQFGEFQGILSVMSVVSIFASAFSYFTVKYSSVFALHNDLKGQLEFIRFIKKKFKSLALVCFIFFICLLPIAKDFIHLNDYGGLIIVGITLLVSFYSSFYVNSLQGWSNFTALSFIGVAAVLIKVISGYLAARFFPSSSSVMFSFFIPTLVSWQIARIYIEKKWKKQNNDHAKEKDNSWKEKYFKGLSFKKSFTSILFFSAGLTLLGSADILIIRNIADPETAGYYGALSVLGKTVFSLNLAFISVLFPDACSEGYFSQPAKSRSVIGSYILMFLVTVPAITIFYFFPNLIIDSLFGKKYADVASSLWLFGIMGFFLSLVTVEAKLSLARHDFRSTFFLFFTTVIFSSGIYFFHSSLKAIIAIVTVSLAIGWIGILLLNWVHRYKYKARMAQSQA